MSVKTLMDLFLMLYASSCDLLSMRDREVVSRQVHVLKIAGSIPAPATNELRGCNKAG